MSAVVERREPEEGATALIQAIERAAINPAVDVEKMERLFALQERMMARNAEAAFNEAMRACQSEMPKVKRTKDNSQTNSKYADLEHIAEKATPIYTRHGFSMSYGTADCPLEGHARVTCLVSHVSGHSRTYQCDVPLDLTGPKGNQNKTATHAFGSTMSYGRRYLVVMIFNITLTNEDQDGNQTGACITESQVADLMALAEEVNADRAKFLKYMKVERLSDIPAIRYQIAVKALEAKRVR